ncbi:A24 family peptidase [Paraburkholderia sp. HP33-1]|uniref:A24 family peptidase n=1 Tax=Paraburkholderia sp. HP33-1 TaxID=2883243 RepID=UPI001F2A6C28|nr:prepilin peptidase [Paraburkholderia sp. HP33-1]
MLYAAKSAACLVLASLAVHDIRSRRLPTRAVLLVACLYGIDAAVAGVNIASLAAHLGAAAIAFALFALLFRCGWMGGGDVKLAAAVFLWAGPAYAWPVFFIVSCAGLVLGLTALIMGLFRRRVTHSSLAFTQLASPRGVPYGVPLALGGIAAVWLPVLNLL